MKPLSHTFYVGYVETETMYLTHHPCCTHALCTQRSYQRLLFVVRGKFCFSPFALFQIAYLSNRHLHNACRTSLRDARKLRCLSLYASARQCSNSACLVGCIASVDLFVLLGYPLRLFLFA